MIVHLIRHTTPAIAAGVCYGQTDLGLTQSFEQESSAIIDKLHDSYDAVYSSPLQRCLRLAEKISANQLITDRRLMEYSFGDWEMKTWDEIQYLDSHSWFDDYVNQPAPNGENLLDVQHRVRAFMKQLHSQKFKKVALVTHAGVIRLLHAEVFSIPLQDIFKFSLEYGSVLEISYQQSGEPTGLKRL